MIGRFEQFSFAISSINRYVQKLERDEMIKYGYKGSYAQYLVVMHRHPEGITSAQLCEICDRDKAAVSRVVTEMKKKGIIKWENKNDSRYRARLILTDEGKKAAEFVCERACAAVAVVGETLGEQERKIFYGILDMFAEKLQILTKDGIPAVK